MESSECLQNRGNSNVLSDRIRRLLKRPESLIPIETDSKAYILALSPDNGGSLVEVFDVGDKAEFKVYEELFKKKKRAGTSKKALSINETSLDDFKSKIFELLTQDEPFKSSSKTQLIRDIHNLYCNFYDSETYASLYDESRTHISEPIEVLSSALKSILQIRAKTHIEETKKILQSFFSDKYFYFPKMALYIIGNNIDTYSDLFWDALEKDTSNLVFGEIYFGDELKHVFENLSELSRSQGNLIIKKLDKGPGYGHKEDVEKHIAEWKQERCQALIKFPAFKEMYKTLKTQTDSDRGLHAAVGEIIVREGGGPSPLTKEDILNKLHADELPSFLNDFKSTDAWEYGPTSDGLARLIRECVAEEPNRFIDNLTPFIDTGFTYVYEIIDGTREAWKNKQKIAWGNLFEFINQYINRDKFWNDKLIVEKDKWLGGANHLWIIGAITELIKEGTRNDSWAFNEQYLGNAESLLFLIFDNLEIEEEKTISDYVSHALNSTHGKTLEAFINLALRTTRLQEKKGIQNEVKWSKKIKGKYDELLDSKIIESYTYLGRYLPNLYYLDKAWTEDKVKSLHSGTVNCYWEAFMGGYLSTSKVYDVLYTIMIPHFKQGITANLKFKHYNEQLVQHICLGYLLGYENRGESDDLIMKILENWNAEQIMNMISFFWSQQKHLEDGPDPNKEVVKKIILIWKWIYDNKYKDKSDVDITDEDRKIQSSLAKLTVFLPIINEEYSKWLLLIASYVHVNYNSPKFVECLYQYNDKESVGYVGKLYLTMLNSFTPDFDKKYIRTTIDKLYAYEFNEDADNICNIYGMRGYHFLRELYDKYNP